MNNADRDKFDRERLTAAIVASPTYRLAQNDTDFIESDASRGARLEMEMMRPEEHLKKHNVHSTVVVFGSARTLPPDQAQHLLDVVRAQMPASPSPEDRRRLHQAERQLAYSRYYEEARQFAFHLSHACQTNGDRDLVVVTGGGPGIMEAANRGAYEAGAISVGLNIHLPREQMPNPYITPGLAFRFRYFAMRKMHFMLRAKALIVFPGGFGTMDELFEALTLVQTNTVEPIPIVLVGRDYWQRAIDLDFLVEEGFIDERERALATVVDTGIEAANHVLHCHGKAAM